MTLKSMFPVYGNVPLEFRYQKLKETIRGNVKLLENRYELKSG
jgi:hypothetical protein